MRLLALSDIHGQVDAVQRLRAQESNDFDAVVVAGDIGGDSADQVFGILATFGCPVLYVYGNHDHVLAYDHPFPGQAHHLHLQAVSIGNHLFTGYSGLPAHWGGNPVAVQLQAEVEHKHRDVIVRLAELVAGEAAQIEAAEVACQEAIRVLDTKTTDRRRKAYRDKADRIYMRKHKVVGAIQAPAQAVRESRAWQDYEADRWAASSEALRRNRQALAELVNRIGPARCIVVTHERQTDTAQDMAGVPLFLFGHQHGYKNTTFKGSRFVNVSALDAFVTMLPDGLKEPTLRDMRNMDIGTYATIEINKAGHIDAQPRHFMEIPAG
jgi:hypothetical protein